MPDMLVNLLKLAPVQAQIEELRNQQQIIVRRANPWEMSRVREYALKWSPAWGDEATIAFARQPITCFIAVVEGEVAGFCAYEISRRDYLGPIGVDENLRGKNVGKALLLASFWGLREMGYAYAIIGGVGPADFYTKTCGAVLIEGSDRGVYVDMLNKRPS